MHQPSPTRRPFPIPVATFGGRPQEGDAPEYLVMPKDMGTFHVPSLPDETTPELLNEAATELEKLVERMIVGKPDFKVPARLDMEPLPLELRKVIGQSLGFGEVSAFTCTEPHWRVQETAFAGLWRVIRLNTEQGVEGDWLEISPIPAVLIRTMEHSAERSLQPPFYAPGVMNAEALVEEIRQVAEHYVSGSAAHIINLTLLPVSETDLDTLYEWLGHREVSILSRGYGSCRITSTRLVNVWWVQYFNSMDTLILNSIEIVDMPEVALAAREDFEDTLVRLGEYATMLRLTQ